MSFNREPTSIDIIISCRVEQIYIYDSHGMELRYLFPSKKPG